MTPFNIQNMRTTQIALISFLLLLGIPYNIADATLPDGFERATRTKGVSANYPYGQARENSSGVVQLIIMIDKDGKPFEIMVAESSLPAFSNAAVYAVRKWEFSSATLNGKPVESKQRLRYKFQISQQKQGASPSFTKYYKRLMKELGESEPNLEAATKHIKNMDKASIKNLYALTYAGLAWFEYSKRFGTVADQIAALKDIVLFDVEEEKEQRVLSDTATFTIMDTLLKLLLNNNRYSEFLNYYNVFKPIDPQINNIFSETVDKVKELQTGTKAFAQDIEIGARGFTSLDLFKRVFYFETKTGQISELKLRCDTKFAKFSHDDKIDYQIPASWGNCNVQVFGEPGSEAQLIQQ